MKKKRKGKYEEEREERTGWKKKKSKEENKQTETRGWKRGKRKKKSTHTNVNKKNGKEKKIKGKQKK